MFYSTLHFAKSLLFTLSVFSISLLFSCGSDDEADDMEEELDANPTAILSFTLDGTDYTAIFDESNPTILVSSSSSVNATSFAANGQLEEGGGYTFAGGFIGSSTGSYTLTGNDDEDDLNSLGIVITQDQTFRSFIASSVEMDVTVLTNASVTNASDMEATFEGTMVDEESGETVSLTNGRISVEN